ncbi:MAG: D-alanine--D-alanine ligase [Bacteroidetes bacterium]|nr:MAG: D-alanine--D-alanine ligase [Bacteroidota bacterium]PTM11138.1 MAG: D-alanine--D-alanine ligase [Bacteroidota bacterium]
MKIRVGIFFGGPSREREISFAGGRTVYDNLNQQLFTPIPIFVDSHRNWVILDWHNVYKGSIRDFYPPVAALPSSPNGFQIYAESIAQPTEADQLALLAQVGQPVNPAAIAEHIDVAFLALHGIYGEDGQLQQQLQDLGIPYTGCGVRASQLGMDKAWQKELMQDKGFACPRFQVLKRAAWLQADVYHLYESVATTMGWPLVIRPANQGSSIGVSIIDQSAGLEGFEEAINQAFFREVIPMDEWQDRTPFEKVEFVKLLADIRDGLGFPMQVVLGEKKVLLTHPEELLRFFNTETAAAEHRSQVFILESNHSEEAVILESFIRGQEFSCIVLRSEDGSAIALPPTEIIKGGEVFDYRAKYMPGLSRKETPINLPTAGIEAIRRECESLFTKLAFQVYARIDGFYSPEGTIFLNDPNTTSGMLPSSFFFHQAAEIGLNPSQFLTYILRVSLQERLQERPEAAPWRQLLGTLDQGIGELQQVSAQKKRIGIILGGYSFERHISVESGRNIYEKLASSVDYEPIPIFLTGSDQRHRLYQLPLNLLLKDNADDIKDKIAHWKSHPLLEQIRRECAPITQKYASARVIFSPQELTYDGLPNKVDGVFIALHGRPGEDGQIQMALEARQLPYNGSGIKSSSITIDKFRTLQTLALHGLPVARQLLLTQQDFKVDEERFYQKVEQSFAYPLIAKPVDDGCSSAVKVIHNREQLRAYSALIFRMRPEEEDQQRHLLKLKIKEEFPDKGEILFEELITRENGIHFLEITGGMLTHYDERGQLQYEIFEPSETLSSGEVLSLEEKFLAGEGQNLTPARLAVAGFSYEEILPQVQQTLERAARLVQVEGYCRIDAFVRILANGKVETQVIEINSLPGMTPATAIFHQAALAGYKPAEFIRQILVFGFQRQAKKAAGSINEQQVPVSRPEVAASAAPGTRPLTTAIKMEFTPPAAPQPPQSFTPPTPGGQQGNSWVSLLRSRYIWKNIAAMLGVLLLAFFLMNIGLNLYTNHGNSVQVENYKQLTIDKATQKARSRGFKVSVNEAPFTLDIPQGDVIDQEPKPLKRIKKNRTIYLTIIGPPKEVPIPSFEEAADDYSRYRQKLRPLHIRTVVKEGVFDARLADSTILHFYYQGRKYSPSDLKRGIKIMQGSTLEFVVTKSKDDFVRTPLLICKRFSEVSFLLPGLDLSIGDVIGDVSNRADAYVWKQDPPYSPGAKIMRGQKITIYLQENRPDNCPPEVETDEPPSDTGGFDEDSGMNSPTDTTSTGGQ